MNKISSKDLGKNCIVSMRYYDASFKSNFKWHLISDFAAFIQCQYVFQGTKNPSYGCYHESNIQKTAVTKGQ